MKIEIIEDIDLNTIIQNNEYWNRPSTPLTYRIAIKLQNTIYENRR
jgi:hypothetical protein